MYGTVRKTRPKAEVTMYEAEATTLSMRQTRNNNRASDSSEVKSTDQRARTNTTKINYISVLKSIKKGANALKSQERSQRTQFQLFITNKFLSFLRYFLCVQLVRNFYFLTVAFIFLITIIFVSRKVLDATICFVVFPLYTPQ